MDIIQRITDFESGKLEHQEVVELFQFLLESGMIHKLQGSYHRIAQQLLTDGEIHMPKYRH